MPPLTELFLMICIVLTPSIRPGGISVVQKHTPVGHSPNYDCIAATRGGGVADVVLTKVSSLPTRKKRHASLLATVISGFTKRLHLKVQEEVHGEAGINWFGCDRWCDFLEEETSRRLRR